VFGVNRTKGSKQDKANVTYAWRRKTFFDDNYILNQLEISITKVILSVPDEGYSERT
jgi:hypothetical protein